MNVRPTIDHREVTSLFHCCLQEFYKQHPEVSKTFKVTRMRHQPVVGLGVPNHYALVNAGGICNFVINVDRGSFRFLSAAEKKQYVQMAIELCYAKYKQGAARAQNH